jgi:uncharacterized protein (TIGR00369 family)
MSVQISAKQENSRMCFVCGLSNQLGLHSVFYELEDGRLYASFEPKPEHQGYPERLHGGIAAAILDETIGRAILIEQPNVWGVTAEIKIRYRKPVPLDGKIQVAGRITRDTRRMFEGTGEILLADGQTAVEAHGKYLKLPLEEIAEQDFSSEDWRVVSDKGDPETVDL